jgi:hypothetical protein
MLARRAASRALPASGLGGTLRGVSAAPSAAARGPPAGHARGLDARDAQPARKARQRANSGGTAGAHAGRALFSAHRTFRASRAPPHPPAHLHLQPLAGPWPTSARCCACLVRLAAAVTAAPGACRKKSLCRTAWAGAAQRAPRYRCGRVAQPEQGMAQSGELPGQRNCFADVVLGNRALGNRSQPLNGKRGSETRISAPPMLCERQIPPAAPRLHAWRDLSCRPACAARCCVRP